MKRLIAAWAGVLCVLAAMFGLSCCEKTHVISESLIHDLSDSSVQDTDTHAEGDVVILETDAPSGSLLTMDIPSVSPDDADPILPPPHRRGPSPHPARSSYPTLKPSADPAAALPAATPVTAPGLTPEPPPTGMQDPTQTAPSSTPAPSPSPVPTSAPLSDAYLVDNGKAQYMLELVNQAREDNGLPPLEWDSSLTAPALKHCMDMAQNNFFGHVSPTWGGFETRVTASGAGGMKFGENLAYVSGYDGTTSVAHEGLMNSPDHRTNILDPEYTRIGIASVWDSQDNITYFVQWFAR